MTRKRFLCKIGLHKWHYFGYFYLMFKNGSFRRYTVRACDRCPKEEYLEEPYIEKTS